VKNYLRIIVKLIILNCFVLQSFGLEPYICMYTHMDKKYKRYKHLNFYRFMEHHSKNLHNIRKLNNVLNSTKDETFFYVTPGSCKKFFFFEGFVDLNTDRLYVQNLIIHANNLLNDYGELYIPILEDSKNTLNKLETLLSDTAIEQDKPKRKIWWDIVDFVNFKAKKRKHPDVPLKWLKFTKTSVLPYNKSIFEFMLKNFGSPGIAVEDKRLQIQ